MLTINLGSVVSGMILYYSKLNVEASFSLYYYSNYILTLLPSPLDRSLFASKIIQTGDCILKVPYRVVCFSF